MIGAIMRPPSTPSAPALLAALLATVLLGGAAAARQARDADAAPMVVTTDTRDYCLTLSDQIQSYGALPDAVRGLQVEGRALCSEGQVRGGINRLRRALMVLRAGHEPAEASRAVSSSGRTLSGRSEERPGDTGPDSPDE